MTLPDIKFNADFTEKPLAGKQRASDDAVMLDINIDSQALPDGAATSANQTNGNQLAQVTQNVTASDVNSSVVNLAAGNGYTFTGTLDSTLGVNSIQVSLKTDQNCIVRIEQSPDNTPNWDLSDEYHYTANANFGVTVQAISSYFRVVVFTNNETTTFFRLQSVLCPIADPLPRSLDANQNLKVANPMDAYGWLSENTPMGETRVAEPTRLVGANFEGTTIDTRFWTAAAAGTAATIAQANAQLLITSGTSNAALVTMFSIRRARYVSGIGMRYRAVIQVSVGLANNKRRWGLGWGSVAMPTVTDGAWFQLDGTEFSIVTSKGGTPTKVTAFNGNLGLSYTPGINAKTYEIYWTNSKVYFVIGDEILHTVSASTATWADTMNFHIFADSLNAAALGASTTLATRVASISRLGKYETQPTSYYHASGQTAGITLKNGPGNVHSVIFGGAANNAVVTLADSVSDATNPIWVYTATGALASPVSVDFKGLPFFNGLRMIVATGNASFTVVYE